jgi:hypothetical protein
MTKPERNYLVIRPLSLIRHSTFRIRHLLMAACTVDPFNSIRSRTFWISARCIAEDVAEVNPERSIA